MFTHKHYVPILKAKAGEFWALSHIKPTTKPKVTPLMELVPQSQRVKKGKDGKVIPPKPISSHLQKMCDGIWKAWGEADFIFVDAIHFGTQQANHPSIVVTFFDLARQRKLQCVPVTSLGRPPAVQTAIKSIVGKDNCGAAIRLSTQDFVDPKVLSAALSAIANQLGLANTAIDLIIDYGAREEQAIVMQLMGLHIPMIPTVTTWRTLTVSSGAFPPSLKALAQSGQWHKLPRFDWDSWKSALTGSAVLARKPSYSDYAIRDPAPPSDFGASSANLRYTCDDYFLVRQERKVTSGGAADMRMICADLVLRPEFKGVGFSEGDQEIHALQAGPQGSSGNPQQWIQWGTSHHLEHVVDQMGRTAGL